MSLDLIIARINTAATDLDGIDQSWAERDQVKLAFWAARNSLDHAEANLNLGPNRITADECIDAAAQLARIAAWCTDAGHRPPPSPLTGGFT
jgi:hypothetical protein